MNAKRLKLWYFAAIPPLSRVGFPDFLQQSTGLRSAPPGAGRAGNGTSETAVESGARGRTDRRKKRGTDRE